MGARIEVADGEFLHVRKKLVAQLQKRARGDADHQAVIEVRADDAGGIDREQDGKLADKAGKVRIRAADPWHDILVDDGLEHIRARNVRPCAQHDADEHQHELEAVSAKVGEQPRKGALHVLRTVECVFSLRYRRHFRPPPSAEIQILRGRSRCAQAALHACRHPRSCLHS